MQKISAFFYRISKGWVAIVALLIFILFSALALPGQSALAEKYSQGAGSPDTSLFYSGSQLYDLAGAYGAEGRQAFLKARWTFDVAFPLIYTFFFITAASWLLARHLPPVSKWRLLNLLPLAAMLLDFLENTATSLVMFRYPVHCPPGELLAPLFTPLKWLLVLASTWVLLFGLLYLVVRVLRRK